MTRGTTVETRGPRFPVYLSISPKRPSKRRRQPQTPLLEHLARTARLTPSACPLRPSAPTVATSPFPQTGHLPRSGLATLTPLTPTLSRQPPLGKREPSRLGTHSPRPAAAQHAMDAGTTPGGPSDCCNTQGQAEPYTLPAAQAEPQQTRPAHQAQENGTQHIAEAPRIQRTSAVTSRPGPPPCASLAASLAQQRSAAALSQGYLSPGAESMAKDFIPVFASPLPPLPPLPNIAAHASQVPAKMEAALRGKTNIDRASGPGGPSRAPHPDDTATGRAANVATDRAGLHRKSTVIVDSRARQYTHGTTAWNATACRQLHCVRPRVTPAAQHGYCEPPRSRQDAGCHDMALPQHMRGVQPHAAAGGPRTPLGRRQADLERTRAAANRAPRASPRRRGLPGRTRALRPERCVAAER